MSSASKTLELLSLFSPARPENRLGPIVLQLAQTREATVPRKTGARAVLKTLAETTGETAHVSVLAGDTLYHLDACESQMHSTRVIIDIQKFPLHATASGLCALAFGPATLMQTATADMQSFTPETPTTTATLEAQIAYTRSTGIARSIGSYQTDTHSLSAPLFDASGALAGAVSVASVATRFTAQTEPHITQHLIAASRQITHNWGGSIPASLEQVWTSAPSPQPAQETPA